MKTRCLIQMVLLSVGLAGSCSKPSEPKRQSPEKKPPSQPKVSKEAETLTEKAYDLKLMGDNRAALELFERAHALFVKGHGPISEAVASNLDDQATVHLRLGEYKEAQTKYEKAVEIQTKVAPGGSRLAESIGRRIATLNALKKHNIVCREPPTPATAGKTIRDAGPPLPYFPDKAAVYEAFAELAGALNPCLKGPETAKPIPVWMVLLGTGQIVLSQTKGALAGTPTARCIESALVRASGEYAQKMPKFTACYRNFTYPFLVQM